MNIEQANAIPLSAILEKIGLEPVKRESNDIWYLSPFRNEKTASFHIHVAKNVWYDFGAVKGGDAVNFVCAYLESEGEDHTVVDALRWLQNMIWIKKRVPAVKESFDNTKSALSVSKITQIQHQTSKSYLASRGIPFALARKYLKEIYVRNHKTAKYFFALALANESGGYELRNKFFKGSIAPKAISFIRGAMPTPDDIHVFEGMMDFLSAVSREKGGCFNGDVIILNSLSCVAQVCPYINNYTYKKLYSWLDNDASGEKTAQILKALAKDANIPFKPMNKYYSQHKDVNAWHMHQRNLTT